MPRSKKDNKMDEILSVINAKQKKAKSPFYRLRSILGYDWAIYYFLLGGRMAGKSYAVADFYVSQFFKYGRPFYWLRLTEASTRKLLNNNASKLIDPDLQRRYNLHLKTKGENVYNITIDENGNEVQTLMCKVLALSTFYSDKGNGFYDQMYLKENEKGYYNICLDEMNREANEKNTFDIIYAFSNEIENIVRNTKHNIRIICIGNTLQEASDLLCAVNFLPDHFGRVKLVKHKKELVAMIKDLKKARTDKELREIEKKYAHYDKKGNLIKDWFGKRAVIEYMEPTDSYKAMRNGSAAEILAGNSSTFTNEVEIDSSLIARHKRLIKPTAIIKFRKEKDKWFTVWDSNIIAPYNGQQAPTISMRPYLDELYIPDLQKSVITLFDTRSYLFKDLSTFKRFQKELRELKPRK